MGATAGDIGRSGWWAWGWGRESWPEALPEALTPELVVHDGERGLGPMIARRYPEARPQRCAWHLVHRLDYQLWRDGIGNLLRLRLARRHNPDDYDAVWDDDSSSDITLEAQIA